MINKRLPIADKWEAAPICICPSGKKERGEGEGGNRGEEGDFGRLGGYFFGVFGVFWSFFNFFGVFKFFLRFLKGNKFVVFLAPITVNKGKIFLLSISTRSKINPCLTMKRPPCNTLQICFKFTKGTNFTRVHNTSHVGLPNLLINKFLGDRSRVHMHGFEPRKIALQQPRRKATREMLPKPKLFFTKERKKETSLKCEGSAHYSINQILIRQE